MTRPEHLSKTSGGSLYWRLGTHFGPFLESKSTTTTSAISATSNGRVEKASHCRNLLASLWYLLSIFKMIRSYVSSKPCGRSLNCSSNAARLEHVLSSISCNATHRNLKTSHHEILGS